MSDDLLAGIDCGATKVMVQSGVYSSKTNKISPGSINQEFYYSDHPDWNFNFKPVPLDIQKNEYQSIIFPYLMRRLIRAMSLLILLSHQ